MPPTQSLDVVRMSVDSEDFSEQPATGNIVEIGDQYNDVSSVAGKRKPDFEAALPTGDYETEVAALRDFVHGKEVVPATLRGLAYAKVFVDYGDTYKKYAIPVSGQTYLQLTDAAGIKVIWLGEPDSGTHLADALVVLEHQAQVTMCCKLQADLHPWESGTPSVVDAIVYRGSVAGNAATWTPTDRIIRVASPYLHKDTLIPAYSRCVVQWVNDMNHWIVTDFITSSSDGSTPPSIPDEDPSTPETSVPDTSVPDESGGGGESSSGIYDVFMAWRSYSYTDSEHPDRQPVHVDVKCVVSSPMQIPDGFQFYGAFGTSNGIEEGYAILRTYVSGHESEFIDFGASKLVDGSGEISVYRQDYPGMFTTYLQHTYTP